MIEEIRRSDNYQYIKKVAKKYLITMLRDFFVNFAQQESEFKGAFDITDRRDYDYDDFAGADKADISTKSDISKNLSEIQNQGLIKETKYFCTAYSNSM